MVKITIHLSQRRLYFYKNESLINSYPVAVGKPSTPTPPGKWKIINKVINPGGTLGTRWMGLNIPADDGAYGIHGTNQPWSIGKAVSNGCIRMFNKDIEEIFPITPVGTKVYIYEK
ncbi:MAG: ErfK/YbiS/YcfS/YnhG family protein [Clostridia bacterium 41_269]|nr:MAG: ErfK/YbiS/YcfS/YnhG family protein [Clostridia bacterium 41_269]